MECFTNCRQVLVDARGTERIPSEVGQGHRHALGRFNGDAVGDCPLHKLRRGARRIDKNFAVIAVRVHPIPTITQIGQRIPSGVFAFQFLEGLQRVFFRHSCYLRQRVVMDHDLGRVDLILRNGQFVNANARLLQVFGSQLRQCAVVDVQHAFTNFHLVAGLDQCECVVTRRGSRLQCFRLGHRPIGVDVLHRAEVLNTLGQIELAVDGGDVVEDFAEVIFGYSREVLAVQVKRIPSIFWFDVLGGGHVYIESTLNRLALEPGTVLDRHVKLP